MELLLHVLRVQLAELLQVLLQELLPDSFHPQDVFRFFKGAVSFPMLNYPISNFRRDSFLCTPSLPPVYCA
jgi:hypothetical protein